MDKYEEIRKSLPRVADKYKKHSLTGKEKNFIKKLQHEMNTQNTCAQADPRFWVIRDYDKIYGEQLSDPNGLTIYDIKEHEEVIAIDYSYFIREKVFNEIKEKLKIEYKLDDESLEEFDYVCDLQSFEETIKKLIPTVEIAEYQYFPVESGFFFTHEAALKHLEENEHHYSDRVHTFAKTVFRSEEEQLWDILHTIEIK